MFFFKNPLSSSKNRYRNNIGRKINTTPIPDITQVFDTK